ncbi:13269_t:CDS:2, partial [Acaulospora morrowiae]
TVLQIVSEAEKIYNNVKHNKKICASLMDRIDNAEIAIRNLRRNQSVYEKRLEDFGYYKAFHKFVRVLKEIKNFMEDVSNLSGFKRYMGANFVKKNFEKLINERKIGYFDAEMGFSDLPVIPTNFSDVEESIQEDIINNGKKFFEIAFERKYMNYSGSLMRWKRDKMDRCMIVEKINADGRVIIDLKGFAAMNPGYRMGNASPPTECDIKLLDDR